MNWAGQVLKTPPLGFSRS